MSTSEVTQKVFQYPKLLFGILGVLVIIAIIVVMFLPCNKIQNMSEKFSETPNNGPILQPPSFANELLYVNRNSDININVPPGPTDNIIADYSFGDMNYHQAPSDNNYYYSAVNEMYSNEAFRGVNGADSIYGNYAMNDPVGYDPTFYKLSNDIGNQNTAPGSLQLDSDGEPSLDQTPRPFKWSNRGYEDNTYPSNYVSDYSNENTSPGSLEIDESQKQVRSQILQNNQGKENYRDRVDKSMFLQAAATDFPMESLYQQNAPAPPITAQAIAQYRTFNNPEIIDNFSYENTQVGPMSTLSVNDMYQSMV